MWTPIESVGPLACYAFIFLVRIPQKVVFSTSAVPMPDYLFYPGFRSKCEKILFLMIYACVLGIAVGPCLAISAAPLNSILERLKAVELKLIGNQQIKSLRDRCFSALCSQVTLLQILILKVVVITAVFLLRGSDQYYARLDPKSG